MQERLRVTIAGQVDRQRYVRLIRQAQQRLDELGIPYGQISLWSINTRAKRRLGMCHMVRKGVYQIQIAEKLFEAADEGVEEVILHELLHSCPDCMNHGAMWKKYASQVNKNFGFGISTYGEEERLGIAKDPTKKAAEYGYAWECQQCHYVVGYYRRTRTVEYLLGEGEYTDKIRCKCGCSRFHRIKPA